MTESSPILAIDIGGTKLAAALVDVDGVVLRRAEIPTPAAPPSSATPWPTPDRPRPAGGRRRASTASSAWPPPGPLDNGAGTVSPVNIPSWRDFPLRDTVAEAFPGAETVLVGDAVAAAVGEHWRGAGIGAEAMLGIVVSTGVGGGLVLNGRVYPGPTGNAGHFGHIPTDLEPVLCVCGMTGCVEALASGPSMVRSAARQGWQGSSAQRSRGRRPRRRPRGPCRLRSCGGRAGLRIRRRGRAGGPRSRRHRRRSRRSGPSSAGPAACPPQAPRLSGIRSATQGPARHPRPGRGPDRRRSLRAPGLASEAAGRRGPGGASCARPAASSPSAEAVP